MTDYYYYYYDAANLEIYWPYRRHLIGAPPRQATLYSSAKNMNISLYCGPLFAHWLATHINWLQRRHKLRCWCTNRIISVTMCLCAKFIAEIELKICNNLTRSFIYLPGGLHLEYQKVQVELASAAAHFHPTQKNWRSSDIWAIKRLSHLADLMEIKRIKPTNLLIHSICNDAIV